MSTSKYTKNTQIGSWKLEKELGEGGQATVWEVRYSESPHSAPGAMKICKSRDQKSRDRFEMEVAQLKKLKHVGIIQIRDSGVHEGCPYFVMARASASLEKVIAGEKAGLRLIRESPEWLLSFFHQAVEAIAYMHDNDILHRDIKPDNILLMLDPPDHMRAVVSDLGIASPISEQGALTRTHETLGTPQYRAPEVMVGGDHTKASDVYSLGKTLEFLFTRATPSTLGPCRCLRTHRLTTDLWDHLDSILERACAYDPSKRLEDASQLLKCLPEVILARATAPTMTRAPTSTLALKPEEAIVLGCIIAHCKDPEGSIHPKDLRLFRATRSLDEFEISMSIRWLADCDFVEWVTCEAEYGNTWRELRATNAGVKWARENPVPMKFIANESQSPDEIAPAVPSDDDIPF